MCQQCLSLRIILHKATEWQIGFLLIISYLFNTLNKEVSFIKLHWLHSRKTTCSHLYVLSFHLMIMYLYIFKMKLKTCRNHSNTLGYVYQASLRQTNYRIGDSLWNKISAEFGLYSPKWPSSFLLVPNGHTMG